MTQFIRNWKLSLTMSVKKFNEQNVKTNLLFFNSFDTTKPFTKNKRLYYTLVCNFYNKFIKHFDVKFKMLYFSA